MSDELRVHITLATAEHTKEPDLLHKGPLNILRDIILQKSIHQGLEIGSIFPSIERVIELSAYFMAVLELTSLDYPWSFYFVIHFCTTENQINTLHDESGEVVGSTVLFLKAGDS